MSRDDSMLYSGSSSASFGTSNAEKIRANAKEEKREKRAQLLPVGELVKSEIQREINMLRNIDYVDLENMMTDEHFRAEMMARKKTVERLIVVQNRLSSILRKSKATKDEDSLGAEDE